MRRPPGLLAAMGIVLFSIGAWVDLVPSPPCLAGPADEPEKIPGDLRVAGGHHDEGSPYDDPGAREAWFVRQRAYPFASFPAGAYTQAAEGYLLGREAVRRRYFVRTIERAAAVESAPEALPLGPWSEAGPSPILDDGSQTGLTFGNVAGRISTVAIHRSRPDVILIGASRGGLWRSTDGGQSWTPVGDDQVTLVIADVKFAPSNPNVAYAATGDDDVGFWGAGVLKSVDGGVTWARIDNGSAANGIPNGTVLAKLVVDPDDAGTVVVAGFRHHTDTGAVLPTSIFRTTNGGATWTRASLPVPGDTAQFKSLVIEESCPSRLWAVDYLNHTVIRSQDGGASWMTVATSGLPAFTLNTKIAVHHGSCAGPATLYASVNSGAGLAGSPGYPGVYRSLDDGASWALPGSAPGPSGGCLGQCHRYDHELFVDPTDANRLVMLGRDVWISTDAGATWVNRSGGFDDANTYAGGRMHVDLHDAAFQRTGPAAVLFLASDGGLWSYDVSTDTFTNRNGNLSISELVDLAVNPVAPYRALGGLQDNGTVLYGGSRLWSARVRGDGGETGWLRTSTDPGGPFDGAFTSFVQNYGYLSLDVGRTWTGFGVWAGPESFSGEVAEFYAPWLATAQGSRVWHGAQSLWYCDVPQTCFPTWHKQADRLAALTGSFHTSKLAIHSPAPGVNGPFYVANAFPRGFLQSPDGVAWNVRSAGLPDRYISDITFEPSAPGEVYVTLQGFGTGHVWRSLDGGATWQDRSGNLPNVPSNDILLDPQDPSSTWYVAMDIGVYGTADAGASWSVVGHNLPAVWVNDLEIGPNRILYAATGGRSVWTIALPGWTAPPEEIAGSGPMLLDRVGSRLAISWPDTAPAPGDYNVYEGVLGSWYSHAPLACHLEGSVPGADGGSGGAGASTERSGPAIDGRGAVLVEAGSSELTCGEGLCTALLTPGDGSRYYLVTASGSGSEAPAGPGPGWRGPDHVLPPIHAVTQPCGGRPAGSGSAAP